MDRSLRDQILDAFNSPDGSVLILNQGTLEDELWTDESWRDEYADLLTAELNAMVADDLLNEADLYGIHVYSLKGT